MSTITIFLITLSTISIVSGFQAKTFVSTNGRFLPSLSTSGERASRMILYVSNETKSQAEDQTAVAKKPNEEQIPVSEKPKHQQAEYGNELPFPKTYIKCASCSTIFAMMPDDLGLKGKGR